jgi:hypothetical protein
MTTGIGGSLNGFLPFSNSVPTLYGPAAWNYQVYNVGTSTMTPGVALDPNSAAIIAQINQHDRAVNGGNPSKLHPDFGPVGGMPYTVVDSSVQPSVNLYGLKAGPPGPDASQSDAVVEPAPINAPIEGQQPDCLSYPANGEGEGYYFGDTHMIIVDRNQCFLYETYLTAKCDGVISAGGQAVWDLQNGEVRPYGWTSTDAAGLPVWPGLVKYDEAATGVINHAFRFTVNHTKGDGNGGYFVFPAGHGASYGPNFKYLNVMGMRMILNPTTDITSFSTMNQTILTAMMQYGLILADNGSDMYVTGTTDSNWNTDDLGNWHGGGPIDCGDPTHNVGDPCYLTSADFEVIQMSPEDVNSLDLASTSWTAAQSYSYMDANSAPYTVADVEAGITADGDPGDPNAPTPSGTVIAGGLGPEGTGLVPDSPDTAGKYPDSNGVITSGPPPVINSFQAQYTIFGIPIGANICGTTISVDTALPIAFVANITGSTYQYVDNAGPFRVDGSGNGLVYSTVANTQDYTLYAMNSYGMIESSTCTLSLGEGILPIPVLSPTTGTYSTIISVTISDPGYPGATIYYTTDESIPAYPVPALSTEQIYTGAIVITGTTGDPVTYLPGEQINAIAVDPDFAAPSGIGSAVYVVNSQAATPVINPAGGTFITDNTPLAITITDSTNPIDMNQDGDTAVIYYTTDGTTPGGDWYGDATGTSIACGNPCNFTLPAGVTTVNAVANAVGYTVSEVATATYNETIDYFTVTVAPTAIIIDPAGNASSVGVTVASLGGYTGTVSLSCSGLPPGDQCTFNPTSVSVTATTPGISTLTISAGLNSHNNSFPLLPGGATLAVALCFFGLRKRRSLQLIVLLGASVIGLSLFTGCGTPGSVPNTVTVTITGTDSNGITVNSYLTVTQMQSQ